MKKEDIIARLTAASIAIPDGASIATLTQLAADSGVSLDETVAPAPAVPAPAPAPPLFVYEVAKSPFLKIGGVKAYTNARVNLTAADAKDYNDAEPGVLVFLGK